MKSRPVFLVFLLLAAGSIAHGTAPKPDASQDACVALLEDTKAAFNQLEAQWTSGMTEAVAAARSPQERQALEREQQVTLEQIRHQKEGSVATVTKQCKPDRSISKLRQMVSAAIGELAAQITDRLAALRNPAAAPVR